MTMWAWVIIYMSENNKNKYQHNDDGTTYIFVESKSKRFPGKHTIIIDTEDWDKVKEHRWCVTGNDRHRYPYAMTNIPHPDGGWHHYTWHGREERRRRRIGLQLHHAIMGKPPKGLFVDHINHNGLDNRKENLRFVTLAQNQQNGRSNRNSTSAYKGVSWHERDKRWRAQIAHEGKGMYIGYFTCEHEAALAYNKKAKELFGEHALLNEVNNARAQ